MNSGENLQALRKIADFCRLIAFALLLIHLYVLGYAQWVVLGMSSEVTDRLLAGISRTGLFADVHRPKVLCLLFLSCSLLGTQGKKEMTYKASQAIRPALLGLLIFAFNIFLFALPFDPLQLFVGYAFSCLIALLLYIRGITRASRILKQQLLKKDIFNTNNQTFPQQEELLENEFSINLPAEYRLGEKQRKSWINIINPFRGLLVLGNPGAGKSYFVIRHVIAQHIKKGFSMFVYDFKYDDLSRTAYYHWRQRPKQDPVQFFCINFEDLRRSHRCNPLEPATMNDISDAAEAARSILLGMNRDWIKRQGDFFIESSINLLTAVIWYLKQHQQGQYCTLPHVIELMQQDYDRLFSLLRSNPEIEVLINPFVNAYLNRVMEQLEGQVASAKIALARLCSPQLYFVLSGNDFQLDINNPDAPKIVCMGNNPQKIQIYGAVLSLYVNRLIKQVNQKDKRKCSLVFDEFPTLYLHNIDALMATARSNQVATCLGIQDISQLRKDYGRDLAEVIMNIAGNLISGQVSGETARQLSERFGKIMQDRQSVSLNQNGTSVNYSQQLDSAIPPSIISGLSSGEFVGLTADDPQTPVKLKGFHSRILNDQQALEQEEAAYTPLPIVQQVDAHLVQQNYLRIKSEVGDLVLNELGRLLSNPELEHLVIQKK